jgi:hypothetical protein
MSAVPLPLPDRAALPGIAALTRATAAVALLDGAFAVTLNAALSPTPSVRQVFQSIAAALLGPDAYRGGLATAMLGALLHALVALAWSALYLVLLTYAPRLRVLVATAAGQALAAAVYGACVWVSMHHVVVPLTRAPSGAMPASVYAVLLVGHMLVVGLPIVRLLRPGVR